jgi:hypothetical protein
MINYNNYVYLRYVLLVNIIAALVPSMSVKGRANDPLLHSTWWTMDQHSAVLVVSLAAILSSALVCWLRARAIDSGGYLSVVGSSRETSRPRSIWPQRQTTFTYRLPKCMWMALYAVWLLVQY